MRVPVKQLLQGLEKWSESPIELAHPVWENWWARNEPEEHDHLRAPRFRPGRKPMFRPFLLVKWARHKFTGKDDTGATLVESAPR